MFLGRVYNINMTNKQTRNQQLFLLSQGLDMKALAGFNFLKSDSLYFFSNNLKFNLNLK